MIENAGSEPVGGAVTIKDDRMEVSCPSLQRQAITIPSWILGRYCSVMQPIQSRKKISLTAQ